MDKSRTFRKLYIWAIFFGYVTLQSFEITSQFICPCDRDEWASPDGKHCDTTDKECNKVSGGPCQVC